jgi:hypothetical protein
MVNSVFFKEGYDFASTVNNYDDMHSKFDSLASAYTSDFMLGYAYYLMETAKFLDGASSESLTAKTNIGIANQCIYSAIADKNLNSDETLKLFNTLYDNALVSSPEEVAMALEV